MITVPGEYTTLPSGYFWVMERESLPVGMLTPKAMANSETSCTARYRRSFSPLFLAGHIQFAEREIPFNPSAIGAKIKLVSASAIAKRLPASGLARAATGA